MPSLFSLGYYLARWDVDDLTRRRHALPASCRFAGSIAHTSKLGAAPDLTTTSMVSMTQPDVDERIAVMRSRIAEQLLHIQRLDVLGRDTSDACEVLDLMLGALAQMKEVKKSIRALEHVW